MALENTFVDAGDPSLLITRPGRRKTARTQTQIDYIGSSSPKRMFVYADQAVDLDAGSELRRSDHYPIVGRHVAELHDCLALPKSQPSQRVLIQRKWDSSDVAVKVSYWKQVITMGDSCGSLTGCLEAVQGAIDSIAPMLGDRPPRAPPTPAAGRGSRR